ncbi:MAG: ParB/RepB/Spo0J family partition protein [Candidatus Falkowbacteria bacterium]|nr:ParB/RepB/Spo0J family partition protein [Candidatus Falkowbacteria bacterium]
MNTGLGRGLGSLIPQKQNNDLASDTLIDSDLPVDGQVLKISPALIKANPRQPRTNFSHPAINELVQSIREYGIIQPLVVTKTSNGYELIAGERRLRAALVVGLKEVPVIVREAHDQEKLEIALIENIQREDLNVVELALAYKQLAEEFNLNQEQLAKKLGKSRPVVANTLRILNLPGEIQLALVNGEITEGHAKILVGLDSEAKQFELFNRIKTRRLTVDDTILEARRMGGTKQARVKIDYADKDKELRLRQFFGAKTEIKRGKKGGQVIVHFYSDDELNEVMKKLD